MAGIRISELAFEREAAWQLLQSALACCRWLNFDLGNQCALLRTGCTSQRGKPSTPSLLKRSIAWQVRQVPLGFSNMSIAAAAVLSCTQRVVVLETDGAAVTCGPCNKVLTVTT